MNFRSDRNVTQSHHPRPDMRAMARIGSAARRDERVRLGGRQTGQLEQVDDERPDLAEHDGCRQRQRRARVGAGLGDLDQPWLDRVGRLSAASWAAMSSVATASSSSRTR